MAIIKKKIWPQWFQKILDGEKKFEVRLADFSCQQRDKVVLEEWNPEKNIREEQLKKSNVCLKNKEHGLLAQEDIEKYGFQIIGFE